MVYVNHSIPVYTCVRERFTGVEAKRSFSCQGARQSLPSDYFDKKASGVEWTDLHVEKRTLKANGKCGGFGDLLFRSRVRVLPGVCGSNTTAFYNSAVLSS
jgi:hypothetical protein